MSKPFDYSKWDNIELSDDEDDVHPNIDRESWFRMKHRSRVEREEREESDKKKIKKEMDSADLRIRELTHLIKSLDASGDDGGDSDDDELEDREGLEAELNALQDANDAREAKLLEYEKNKKWNVDNMCHVVEERTIVNPNAGVNKFTESGFAAPTDVPDAPNETKASGSSEKKEKPELKPAAEKKKAAKPPSEEPKATPAESVKPAPAAITKTKEKVGPANHASISMLSYHEFTEKYADTCEEFMKLSSLDKSRQFLLLYGDVMLQENASNYLLLASLEDEMNGFRDKMRLTARQSQIVSNIAELAKTMRTHPGNVIVPFFKRLEEKEHLRGFNDGLEAFIGNLIKRAVVKRKEIDEERAMEEGVDLADIPREDRLGPGGLDPVEVFDSLPASMQEAFESRNTDQLKKALMEMSPEDAERHLKRCVDSGLWNEG